MRKAIIMTGVFALLAVAATGCDFDGPEIVDPANDPIVGYWIGVSSTADGVTTPLAGSEYAWDAVGSPDMGFNMNRTKLDGGVMTFVGFWRKNGREYFVTFVDQNVTQRVTVSGDELIVHYDEKTLYTFGRK